MSRAEVYSIVFAAMVFVTILTATKTADLTERIETLEGNQLKVGDKIITRLNDKPVIFYEFKTKTPDGIRLDSTRLEYE